MANQALLGASVVVVVVGGTVVVVVVVVGGTVVVVVEDVVVVVVGGTLVVDVVVGGTLVVVVVAGTVVVVVVVLVVVVVAGGPVVVVVVGGRLVVVGTDVEGTVDVGVVFPTRSSGVPSLDVDVVEDGRSGAGPSSALPSWTSTGTVPSCSPSTSNVRGSGSAPTELRAHAPPMSRRTTTATRARRLTDSA